MPMSAIPANAERIDLAQVFRLTSAPSRFASGIEAFNGTYVCGRA